MEAAPTQSALKYRADIDGLRAVAVLAVLAFHIGLLRMTGGFVGVDVFYVISGYLLSAIVLKDIASSRFSVVSFYERRIRRIFPALFAMFIAFSVFAWIYFLPDTLVDYGKSLLASTTFISNFFFWQHSGYFDSPTSNPLLHTWSLAVEEQFYILLPIFVVSARRFFPRWFRASVVLLFAVSLVASAAWVYHDRVTAFYMIHTRAWELLLGTILSFGVFPRLSSPWLRNAVSCLGLAMIAYSVWFFAGTTIFPGLSALLPCVGAALIIGSGESGSSVVSRLLSWRPVVFIGLISYSLYLWHWPVIILHRMGVLLSMGETLPDRFAGLLTAQQYDKLVELALSFTLATLSWLLVERPFRSGRLRLEGVWLFTVAGVAMFALVACASVIVVARGFEERFPARAVEVASHQSDDGNRKAMREGTCFITSSEHFEDYNNSVCLQRDTDKKAYLLLGDSHAAALWHGLSLALPNASVMQATTNNCAPLVGSASSSAIHRDCRKMLDYIFNVYLPAHRVEALLLAARWRWSDIDSLSHTLNWARDREIPVILFGPVPEYDMPLPLLLAYAAAWKQQGLIERHRVRDRRAVDLRLQRLSTDVSAISYISLYEAICPNEDCRVYGDAESKVPLMFDNSHLSSTGSTAVMREIVRSAPFR